MSDSESVSQGSVLNPEGIEGASHSTNAGTTTTPTSSCVLARLTPVWVLCHTSMESVAQGVVERCKKAHIKPNMTDSREVEYKQIIRWNKFDDGFPNIFIDEIKEMAGKDVLMIVSFHSPDVIFEQLSVIYAIPRYMARSFTLVLPYFPTGTMERVDREGQVATAKTLATMLSCMSLTARGPAQILVFDIHALQERFYFTDSVIPRFESAIPLLQRELQFFPPEMNEKLAIAYPDEGAYKRFHRMFKGFQQIICFKQREQNMRHIKIKEGNPKGRHVVIIDDLIQTGGTLEMTLKALNAAGAERVSAYVTHPVFPQDSWKNFTKPGLMFDTFWITDTIPHARDIAKHKPFKLLSIADVLADVFLGYDLLQQ